MDSDHYKKVRFPKNRIHIPNHGRSDLDILWNLGSLLIFQCKKKFYDWGITNVETAKLWIGPNWISTWFHEFPRLKACTFLRIGPPDLKLFFCIDILLKMMGFEQIFDSPSQEKYLAWFLLSERSKKMFCRSLFSLLSCRTKLASQRVWSYLTNSQFRKQFFKTRNNGVTPKLIRCARSLSPSKPHLRILPLQLLKQFLKIIVTELILGILCLGSFSAIPEASKLSV